MKNVFIKIKYTTRWGQTVRIVGSAPQLGSGNKNEAPALSYIDHETWGIKIQVPHDTETLDFRFFITQGRDETDRESGSIHKIALPPADSEIECLWEEKSTQSYFYTSAFSNSIFKHEYKKTDTGNDGGNLRLLVSCLHIESGQELVVAGSSEALGSWNDEKAIALTPYTYGKWYIHMDAKIFCTKRYYKYAIRDIKTKKIIEWENGDNRTLELTPTDSTLVIEQKYRDPQIVWRASGVAIPIFSLRSEKSGGIGEFSDLQLLIDWAAKCKMRIIQTLPINDTTATYTWTDSYPYNAVSIYALHPIYLGLHQYPLQDKQKDDEYRRQAAALNALPCVDYEKVIRLKIAYIKDLYNEIGQEVLNSDSYQEFYKKNTGWLYPYAAFCLLRDKFGTAKIKDWGEFSNYDIFKIEELIKQDNEVKETVHQVFFTQFLLHKQLSEVKAYAYSQGIILKGDIPIGVSPNSVEVWTEPHLFHLDCQTGAPPDDFSVNGQNWGFPTYNWREMKKDNYKWWSKRFAKMANYFDAYRIDHILGFFRIWEIPETSVHGLLGYFSPALPLSAGESKHWGICFDEKLTIASIHQEDAALLFGEYEEEVAATFLDLENGSYFLKKEVDNQKKIKIYFGDKEDPKSLNIRNGLYNICNEVLFIKDKYQADKYHPRISLDQTLRFQRLDDGQKSNLRNLHNDYFYSRHSCFWKEEALGKLPTLISSTDMLACGEDLGMVPASVPDVMNQLQILSLEIQRMPKQLGVRFGDLCTLPYLSVATTSTHDMSPIRMWWNENPDDTQMYYNNNLCMEGEAPKECDIRICTAILQKHLESPAMLTIFPLQDWLSISEKLRRNNPEEERINIPADPQHNWNYRMHLTLEKLVNEEEFAETICVLNRDNGR